jgi:hypothetical protein
LNENQRENVKRVDWLTLVCLMIGGGGY